MDSLPSEGHPEMKWNLADGGCLPLSATRNPQPHPDGGSVEPPGIAPSYQAAPFSAESGNALCLGGEEMLGCVYHVVPCSLEGPRSSLSILALTGDSQEGCLDARIEESTRPSCSVQTWKGWECADLATSTGGRL